MQQGQLAWVMRCLAVPDWPIIHLMQHRHAAAGAAGKWQKCELKQPAQPAAKERMPCSCKCSTESAGHAQALLDEWRGELARKPMSMSEAEALQALEYSPVEQGLEDDALKAAYRKMARKWVSPGTACFSCHTLQQGRCVLCSGHPCSNPCQ